MSPRTIVTTPEADDDARQIDEWWVAHRAPNVFLDELTAAFELLVTSPGVGVRVAHRAIPGLRRYLLRSTRYHLYFVYSDDLLIVIGIWGATRGSLPPLADRAASAQQARATVDLSTAPGFVNRSRQQVVRQADAPGGDRMQWIYELCCLDCDHRYAAKGNEIFQRRCPSCGGGPPGLSFR